VARYKIAFVPTSEHTLEIRPFLVRSSRIFWIKYSV